MPQPTRRALWRSGWEMGRHTYRTTCTAQLARRATYASRRYAARLVTLPARRVAIGRERAPAARRRTPFPTLSRLTVDLQPCMTHTELYAWEQRHG